MLKDAGVVNLAAVNQVQGVISAELERGRLTLQLEGKEQEVPGMAEKRNGAELAKEIHRGAIYEAISACLETLHRIRRELNY